MSSKTRVLFVEDDAALLATCSMGLEAEGYEVRGADSTEEALRLLANEEFPLVVTDIYIDERSGLDILRAARDYNAGCAVIVITGQGTMETVMQATAGGAYEYLAKPFDLTRLLETIRGAERSLAPRDEPEPPAADLPETEMLGFSPVMVEVYKTISRAAPTDAPILIQGESGSGKELVARLIHKHSRRADGPFVAVDCGAIASGIIEGELFGAVRGAYTGAERDRVGLFESAAGGTLFLDEIGEVDESFQLKLLRFLQEKEIRPLGSARSRKVDARVVAAGNRDLAELTREGEFRQDLWFRLNVVQIRLPPLRERGDDIEALAARFLARFNRLHGRSTRLTPDAARALRDYSWPGNVRQLEHLLEKLVILSPADALDAAAVQRALTEIEPKQKPAESLADAAEEQIRKVLAMTGGNKTRAAKILNIERKTLYRKLDRMRRVDPQS